MNDTESNFKPCRVIPAFRLLEGTDGRVSILSERLATLDFRLQTCM